jgi:hypothetical protein
MGAVSTWRMTGLRDADRDTECDNCGRVVRAFAGSRTREQPGVIAEATETWRSWDEETGDYAEQAANRLLCPACAALLCRVTIDIPK